MKQSMFKSIFTRFILNRTNDRATHTKRWIVGYALLFWLLSRLLAVVLMIGCVSVYSAFGMDVEKMTSFISTPDGLADIYPVWVCLTLILIWAPLIEEGMFRLWLGFKKWQVALSLALIPVEAVWMLYKLMPLWLNVTLLNLAVFIFLVVMAVTKQQMWSRLKGRWLVPAIWITSVAFGLAHFIAFSHYSWALVPYMTCMVLAPFFAGCCCAYLRVNLGFGWGVAMHIFNNLPATVVLLLM